MRVFVASKKYLDWTDPPDLQVSKLMTESVHLFPQCKLSNIFLKIMSCIEKWDVNLTPHIVKKEN